MADGWLWRAISQLVPLGTGDEMELHAVAFNHFERTIGRFGATYS